MMATANHYRSCLSKFIREYLKAVSAPGGDHESNEEYARCVAALTAHLQTVEEELLSRPLGEPPTTA
jgi:hypothetical protein